MGKRELRLFEDPDLQKACRPVGEVNDHIRQLLEDLTDTMHSIPGCTALAANQIGVFRRVAVAELDGTIVKLVNPVIVSQEGTQEIEEDCVSFKDIAGIVLRPQRITVDALDETGEKHTFILENAQASRLCHLLDHLDGKILVKQIIRFNNGPIEGE